jgi:pimeloyl-ACP methyl ester carboxylesterase
MKTRIAMLATLLCMATSALAQTAPRTVDIPTRPGVMQRLLLLPVQDAKAVVVLFTGGGGLLRIAPDGAIGAGGGNFLVRSRQLFADQGFTVAVIDAASDRQTAPFLIGFRQTAEHAEDVKATMAWLRQNLKLPVWLVGTSRGTQSIGSIAVRFAGTPDSPDGIVLTSTILTETSGRPVPAMALEKLTVPVLVVHHEQDGCHLCAFSDIPLLMRKLDKLPRKELQTYTGGITRGDPCEALAYHGYNGIEKQVIADITAWIRSSAP